MKPAVGPRRNLFPMLEAIFLPAYVSLLYTPLRPATQHAVACAASEMASIRSLPARCCNSDEGDPRMRWAITTKRVQNKISGFLEPKTMLDVTTPTDVVRSINVTIPFADGLGLELTEMSGEGFADGGLARIGALVVVTGIVEGGGASASEADVTIGDTIVGVEAAGFSYRSVEAVGYDELVGVLRGAMDKARQVDGAASLDLTLKRLRPRGKARVTAIKTNGEELSYTAYEGENLRMGLIRNGGGREIVNDLTARRYDNKPRGTGDCGGNGLCATCVVSVLNGKEYLSPMRTGEKQLLRNVARWRQSCKASLKLADGEEAEIKIQLSPRSEEDE